MIDFFDALLFLARKAISIYAIVWAVPGAIMSAIVSLGDPQRIVFIDHQLSKNVDKLHANRMSMLSAYISTRLFHYWVKYPFIRKRSTTKLIKFKIFMWVNALGVWSWIVLALSLISLKLTGYMP